VSVVTLRGIPREVRQFLERSIEGVEQLEILLLLSHYPERSWDAAAVADQLRLTPRIAAAHLEALGRRALLDVRIGDAVRYRFSPLSEQQAALVRQLAALYRDARGPILAFVAERRRRALEDFADAFRIGEDESDG
jgi:hypothetical protein